MRIQRDFPSLPRSRRGGAFRHKGDANQVVNAVETMYRESPYLPLRQLKCKFCKGVLTIYGRVPTYYLKQLAQTGLQRFSAIEEVINRVEVVEPTARKRPR